MVKGKIYSPNYFPKLFILLDGKNRVLIRPMLSTDKHGITLLFDRLSSETRFLRFHYFKMRLTDQELINFCEIDYEDAFALVAEMFRIDHFDIVGVGRYNRLQDPTKAEVAFVVEDKEQGNGIGTHLLREISLIAREKGITKFVAELMNENVVMLDILRKYDPNMQQRTDRSSISVNFLP